MLEKARTRVLEFRVQIRDLDPTVWRRLRIRDDGTFQSLHEAALGLFGWSGRAGHRFEAWNPTSLLTEHIGVGLEAPGGEALIPSSTVPLRRFFGLGTDSVAYHYGNWGVRFVVENVHTPHSLEGFPVCTAGEGAAPPEECGGVEGFQAFLAGNPWFETGDFSPEHVQFPTAVAR